MQSLKLNPVFSPEVLQKRIEELAKVINQDYKNQPITALGVLKGSFVFYSDLIRLLDLDVTCDFCEVKSYAGTQSTGEARLTLDAGTSLKNKNILIIEDIIDTGLTMAFLKNHILSRAPKSVKIVSLLLKPDSLKTENPADYIGFEISNDFVVGYGLDYQGLYRNLPYLAQIQNLN